MKKYKKYRKAQAELDLNIKNPELATDIKVEQELKSKIIGK